jgi:hypothetical protein
MLVNLLRGGWPVVQSDNATKPYAARQVEGRGGVAVHRLDGGRRAVAVPAAAARRV